MSRAGWLERRMLISASSRLPISLDFASNVFFFVFYLMCSKKVINVRAGPCCPNSPKDATANLKEFFCHKELLRKECDNSSIKLPDEQSKYFPVFPQGIWKFLCIQIPSSEGVCIIFWFVSFSTKKQANKQKHFFFFFPPKWKVILEIHKQWKGKCSNLSSFLITIFWNVLSGFKG